MGLFQVLSVAAFVVRHMDDWLMAGRKEVIGWEFLNFAQLWPWVSGLPGTEERVWEIFPIDQWRRWWICMSTLSGLYWMRPVFWWICICGIMNNRFWERRNIWQDFSGAGRFWDCKKWLKQKGGIEMGDSSIWLPRPVYIRYWCGSQDFWSDETGMRL